MSSDFTCINHGSLIGLTPHTGPAREWVDEHLPDDAQMLSRQIMIEPRYAPPILEALDEEGFTVTYL